MITNIVMQVIFYIFALSAVGSALIVVSTRNPVTGVLSLVMTFIATAGIWILLHAEFLALILIVVYVGAVMTLFLFVVMMLNLDLTKLRSGLVRYLPLGLVIVVLIMIMLFTVIGPNHFGLKEFPAPLPQPEHFSNVKALGLTLYTDFVYPFILAGVLLLAAMIAAITLAFRGNRDRKVVSIKEQLATTKADRLTIVKDKK